jgi:PAS domain S-box-containing protein
MNALFLSIQPLTLALERKFRMSRKPIGEISLPENEELVKGSLQPVRREQIQIEGVTDPKKGETELRDSEEILRMVYEESPAGIEIYDPQGRLIHANKTCLDIFGISNVEEVKVFRLFDDPNIPDKEKERLREGETVHYMASFDFGQVKRDNLYNTTKSGEVDLDVVITPFGLDREASVSGYLVQVQDLTERKRAEDALASAYEEMEKAVIARTKDLAKINEELRVEVQEHKRTGRKFRRAIAKAEAASNAKSEFLANMSHEFRLPMNHIIGFTELLLSQKFGELNKVQEEYLKYVLQSGNQLLSMLSDILDLVQVDSGKTNLELSETNLELLLTNCITVFKERAQTKGVELSMDLDSLPDSVCVDKHKLKKILHNLLSNAIKFTSQGGKVSLKSRMKDCVVRSGRRQGDSVGFKIVEDPNVINIESDRNCLPCIECKISDTGIGIKPEDKPRIFNMFEQLDGSSEKNYQGVGLGLFLSKKLVEMHGGRIFVESQGENKGSVFGFIIPITL